MFTPDKGIAHLHVKDDIPYLVGNRKVRSNRHRPIVEDVAAHMDDLREIVGHEEEEEKEGEPNLGEEVDDGKLQAFAGEEAGVIEEPPETEHAGAPPGMFDFRLPGTAGPVDISVLRPDDGLPVGDRGGELDPEVARLRAEGRGRVPEPDAEHQDGDEGEDDDPEKKRAS